MNTIGNISSARLAELNPVVSAHSSTEQVFAYIDQHDVPYDIHNMDEYAIDIVVVLDHNLCLVYDTT